MAWIKRQKARYRGESVQCLVGACNRQILLSWHLWRDDGMMCTLLVVCIDSPPSAAECLDHALAAHVHPWVGRRGWCLSGILHLLHRSLCFSLHLLHHLIPLPLSFEAVVIREYPRCL